VKKYYYLPAIANLRHEGVFQTRWEACTTSSSETACLDLINNPVVTHGNDFLGLMPVTSPDRTFYKGITIFIDVGEDTILILQTAVTPMPLLNHTRKDQVLSS
jgi:hypothetical protein